MLRLKEKKIMSTTSSKSRGRKAAAPARPQPKGKLGILVALLCRPEGATIKDLAEATGWQDHSVRGAIAGALKRKLGLRVLSEKTDQVRVYRISTEAEA